MQGGATDVPTPGEVLRALKQLLIANPRVRNHPVEDVSQALLVGGYLQKKPGPVVVGEALQKLSRESLGTEEDAIADAEWHELESAGWEPIERRGKFVWRNPGSGYIYPQGVAVSMVREGAETDLPLGPEGGA